MAFVPFVSFVINSGSSRVIGMTGLAEAAPSLWHAQRRPPTPGRSTKLPPAPLRLPRFPAGPAAGGSVGSGRQRYPRSPSYRRRQVHLLPDPGSRPRRVHARRLPTHFAHAGSGGCLRAQDTALLNSSLTAPNSSVIEEVVAGQVPLLIPRRNDWPGCRPACDRNM